MNQERYGRYGDRIAARYDELHGHLISETPATVEFLGALAKGRVLELGIGTGRVALPLVNRGLEVHGIEASRAMVERMLAKPGGQSIPVEMGDFADVACEGPFSVIFVVLNTFFALTTQDEQVRCLENVAERLAEDGVFVIEAFVPDLRAFDRGQRVSAMDLEDDHVLLDFSRHDPVNQRVDAQHVLLSSRGIELFPISLRYAWPSELDLMARIAGMRLRERWGGWRREAFTDQSRRHVSVYERSATAYL